mmetsp:Transcript_84956/g.169743  ORF Transcript_84956/g.169743 Transcript_84956/m.169743 type:complete len:225 (-) Transcript_84956:34-708(-)
MTRSSADLILQKLASISDGSRRFPSRSASSKLRSISRISTSAASSSPRSMTRTRTLRSLWNLRSIPRRNSASEPGAEGLEERAEESFGGVSVLANFHATHLADQHGKEQGESDLKGRTLDTLGLMISSVLTITYWWRHGRWHGLRHGLRHGWSVEDMVAGVGEVARLPCAHVLTSRGWLYINTQRRACEVGFVRTSIHRGERSAKGYSVLGSTVNYGVLRIGVL